MTNKPWDEEDLEDGENGRPWVDGYEYVDGSKTYTYNADENYWTFVESEPFTLYQQIESKVNVSLSNYSITGTLNSGGLNIVTDIPDYIDFTYTVIPNNLDGSTITAPDED